MAAELQNVRRKEFRVKRSTIIGILLLRAIIPDAAQAQQRRGECDNADHS